MFDNEDKGYLTKDQFADMLYMAIKAAYSLSSQKKLSKNGLFFLFFIIICFFILKFIY